MLKKTPAPKFTTDVSIRIPGGHKKIKVTYNYFSPEDWQTILRENPEMKIESALEKVIDAWDGLEAPFSIAEVAAYTRVYPRFSDQLYVAFTNEIHGAPLGN